MPGNSKAHPEVTGTSGKGALRARALLWCRRNARDCVWLTHRHFLELGPAGAVQVIDLGCGSKPYQQHFPEASAYVGVDLPAERSANGLAKRADIYANLAALPVESGRFDVVVCTQVLEHVPDPVAVMREANRVLRPGGRAIITVPFLSAEHETPNDFYCYTSFGICEVLRRAGFADIDVKKQFGFWSAIGEMIYWHYHRKVAGTRWEKYWYAIGTTAFLRGFHLLNRLDPDEKLVLNLFVTARKAVSVARPDGPVSARSLGVTQPCA